MRLVTDYAAIMAGLESQAGAFAVDTETAPIRPHHASPTVIVTGMGLSAGTALLKSRDRGAAEILRRMFRDHTTWWWNGPFDWDALALTFPSLLPDLLDAIEEGRAVDLALVDRFVRLATQGTCEGRSLADASFDYTGFRLTKGEDTWRRHYVELVDLPIEEWPAEAVRYLADDVEATNLLGLHLVPLAAEGDYQRVQFAAAYCNHVRTRNGIRVDREAKEELQARVNEELSLDKLDLLVPHGLVARAIPPQPYAKGTKAHEPECKRKPKEECPCPPKLKAAVPEKKSTLAIRQRVEAVCKRLGLEVPMTTKPRNASAKWAPSVKTDKRTLKELGKHDKPLGQLSVREEKDKLRTSYFPAMEWPFGSGETVSKLWPGSDPLKKSGRSAGRGTTKRNHKDANYPSVNMQQSDPRVRRLFLPEEDHVFAIGDYKAIDLCALAQTIWDLYRVSPLLDQINAGVDPHTKFGARLARMSYESFLATEKDTARCSPKCPKGCKKDEKEGHMPYFTFVRKLAKVIGLALPGGMGIKKLHLVCLAAGFDVDLDTVKGYREEWFAEYPPHRKYLQQWVPAQRDRLVGKSDEEWLAYTTPLGMRRGRCGYTNTANGNALQSPAAEGMKIADQLVTWACLDRRRKSVLYGSIPTLIVHDELVLQVRRGSQDDMDAKARELGRLMVRGMKLVLPDVNVQVDPLLSMSWTKDAKHREDEDGLILVYGDEDDSNDEEGDDE